MPTVYRWDDNLAPALVASGSWAHLFKNLAPILKACLVTGYGATPSAGWTLVDEAEHSLVLRNAAGAYYFFVSESAYSTNSLAGCYIRVYIAQTYTGMVNGIPTGEGMTTGIAGTDIHRIGSAATVLATGYAWQLIADANTCIVVFSGGNNATGSNLDYTSASQLISLYFGSDSAGNAIAVGGFLNTTDPYAAYQYQSLFDATVLTSLKDPATGLLVGTGSLSAAATGLYGVGSLNAVALTRSVFEFSKVPWFTGNVERGLLRGLATDPILSDKSSSTAKNMLDGTNLTHTARQLLVLSVLPDGYGYCPVPSYGTNRRNCFMTNNPGFW